MVKKHQIAPYLNSAVGTGGLVDKQIRHGLVSKRQLLSI